MQPRLRDRQRGVALVTAVPNSSEIVTLERRGPRTHIVPPIAEIEDVFATTIHFPVRDRRHGTEIVKVPLPLVWNSTGDDGETVQFCLAGLEPMIATWLSRRGIKTKRTGARPPLPEQHVYAWTDLAPDPAFINFISTNDRGLIQCVSGAQKAWLIAQAALAWPTQTVVVWAIRVKEAEELAEQLLRWLPTEQVAILTGQHALQRKARVVVATSKYLADVRLRFRTRDLGFALSPEQIFDKDGRYLIQHICHTRFYGFWNDWPSSPYLRDFLTAFFGPAHFVQPRHGFELAPVEVAMVPVRNGPQGLGRQIDMLRLKRLGIWHFEGRNRIVTRLAQALACNDRRWIEEHHPAAYQAMPRQVDSVGIVVENEEHARILHRTLSDWRVVVAPNKVQDDLGRVIFTGSAAERLPVPSVLLQTAVSPERIKQVCVRPENRQSSNHLVVDFDDRFHWRLRKFSQERRARYFDLNWPINGSIGDPLDRFFAGRSRNNAGL